MKITKPGFYDVKEADYHADPCEQPSLSRSVAKLLLDATPAHARAAHPRLNPDYVSEKKRQFDIGHAAEALVLQGESAFVELPFDDFKKKAAQEQRDAAYAAGKIPLKTKDADTVRQMAMVARRQLASHEIGDVFARGRAQQTLVWYEDDLPIRVRFDWLTEEGQPIDYKTAGGSAHPDAWGRRVFDDGLELQDGIYCRGLQRIHELDRRPVMWFVVQETSPPYALSVNALNPEARHYADERAEKAITLWQRCVRSNHWPGYPSFTCYIEPPIWVTRRWESRQQTRAMLKNFGTDELSAAMTFHKPLDQ